MGSVAAFASCGVGARGAAAGRVDPVMLLHSLDPSVRPGDARLEGSVGLGSISSTIPRMPHADRPRGKGVRLDDSHMPSISSALLCC